MYETISEPKPGSIAFARDAVEALTYRVNGVASAPLSNDAAKLVSMPLPAIAAKCLQNAGHAVDVYGDPRLIAEQAMSMGVPGERRTMFSDSEGRQYIQASSPAARPGDFPNILSGLANKVIDTVELDDQYSYSEVSAVLPGGMKDFKPAPLINKGVVEELDELKDAEQFKELGFAEEVMSYMFLRRFGNKWGWTPVMVANDDMAALAEGMIGLKEAWQVTQNRLILGLITSNPTLQDGTALFANRADIGSAANNNDRTAGLAPSDAEWAAMENLYADISGIGTARRVRGTLNVCLTPTGTVAQAARRTFMPLNAEGLEGKSAATTADVGLYRGTVKVVPESELRDASATVWYGMRSPTRLNTATVLRGYFRGYGAEGRRESWWDYERKVTWVSLEGRIAAAIKNWRYIVRNNGTGG